MRGAVSVAMVYYRFDPNNTNADQHSATIVVTTLQVVLYSTVGLGGLTGPLLQVLLPQVRPSPLPALLGTAAQQHQVIVHLGSVHTETLAYIVPLLQSARSPVPVQSGASMRMSLQIILERSPCLRLRHIG